MYVLKFELKRLVRSLNRLADAHDGLFSERYIFDHAALSLLYEEDPVTVVAVLTNQASLSDQWRTNL